MKHSMGWILASSVLLTAPVVVHGWDGTRCEARRMHAEMRREYRDWTREARHALADARRDLRRLHDEQREAVRDTLRDAARQAREAARDARRAVREGLERF
jgi:uncharacterized membrane protein